MSNAYTLSFLGFWLVLATLFFQWAVAAGVKAKQPGAIPGKINNELSHDSLVFRTHRTLMNSLENLPFFIGTFFLAVFSGANAFTTTICVWVFAVARVAYTLFYYGMKTEKNPSPRTYVFLVGLLANLVLFGAVLWAIITG